jgi:hypothetical protein
MNKYPDLPESETEENTIIFTNENEKNQKMNEKNQKKEKTEKETEINTDSIDYNPEISYLGTLINKVNSKVTLYKQKFSKISEIVDIQNSGIEYKGINPSHINKMSYYYKHDKNAFIAPLNIINYEDKFYIGNDIHKFEALTKLLPIDKEVLYFIHIVDSLEELDNYTIMLNDNTKISYVYPHQKIDHFINRLRASYPTLFSMNYHKLKISELTLREKLIEIKLFEKIKLTEIEIFNHLLNFNKKVDTQFRSRIARSRSETELYTRIFELHKFYCIMYTDYSWVNHFFNYLENEIKMNRFL